MQPKKYLDGILDALSGVQAGAGWKCLCPAHEDRTASLSVTEADGKLLFYCHAGCSYSQITDALKARGLMNNTAAKPRLRDASARIEATYDYVDANGNLLFQKVRKEGKKFFQRRRGNDGKWNYKGVTNGIDVPLYRLPEVINAQSVLVCEGEKDADNLATRVEGSIAATCNFDGAGKWRASYNKYFKGKEVYLFEDNDEPGRQHVEKVGRALLGIARFVKVVKFTEMPAKSDVSDWLATGKTPEEFTRLLAEAPDFSPNNSIPIRDEEEPEDESDSDRWALYGDYVQLYESVLDKPRRDIFSEKLLTRDSRGLWVPAINKLAVLRSKAAQLEDNGGLKYKRALIEDHLFNYEDSKPCEFLVYLPEWDKRDRIKEYAEAVTLAEGDVTEKDFCELLKEWLAIAMQRLETPETQNRILILKGDQGIGKDTWIDSLLAGAGQFAAHMSVVTGDKDTFLQLHRGLFLKISEFDKTARTEVSLLKDLITAHSTDLRAQYERDFKRRYVRCSFISSCNVDDILRDHTGSRRYLVFDVDRIEWSYPRTHYDGLQLLAQAQALAKAGYRAGKEAQEAMAGYLEGKTPEDPAVESVEMFLDVVEKHLETLSLDKRSRYERLGWIPNSECNEVIDRVARFVGMKPKTVRGHLKLQGLLVRANRERGYRIDGIAQRRDDENAL